MFYVKILFNDTKVGRFLLYTKTIISIFAIDIINSYKMNIQQMEYIVALDRHKSFSKAAESCYITQATLSTMVKKLEEELDVVIFDRKTNPIITTECGRELVAEAQKVLFHSQRIKQLASEIKGKIEGEIKIGVIPTIAGNLLHRILPEMIKKFPDLILHIQEITTSGIITKLKSGDLDIGIVSTPLRHPELEEEILYYEKLMVYGDISQETDRFLSPENMAGEKIWLLEQGNCLTDQIINICALQNKKFNSNLNFSPNTFDSLLNIVDNLKGLTLIPELYYADLPENRKSRVRDFTTPYPVREISMICFRPFAKWRLMEAVAKEIKNIIAPHLQTTHLKNGEMKIAGM